MVHGKRRGQIPVWKYLLFDFNVFKCDDDPLMIHWTNVDFKTLTSIFRYVSYLNFDVITFWKTSFSCGSSQTCLQLKHFPQRHFNCIYVVTLHRKNNILLKDVDIKFQEQIYLKFNVHRIKKSLFPMEHHIFRKNYPK